jgi:hypothetical protein
MVEGEPPSGKQPEFLRSQVGWFPLTKGVR